jgi:hypothetical protein
MDDATIKMHVKNIIDYIAADLMALLRQPSSATPPNL